MSVPRSSSPHHQQRLIPVDHRSPEKHHQNRRHPQKTPERQFIIGLLPPRQNEHDPEHAAQHRPRENRQQRSLHTQKCPRHQHHFYVAEPHPFSSSQPEVGLRDDPQERAAERRP